jgi:hypothetical protein
MSEYKKQELFAPAGLPEKSQFLRLCAIEHKRNYVFNQVMCSNNSPYLKTA